MDVAYTIPSLYWLVGEEEKVYINEEFCNEVQRVICSELADIKKSRQAIPQRRLKILHYLVDLFVDACGGIEEGEIQKPKPRTD